MDMLTNSVPQGTIFRYISWGVYRFMPLVVPICCFSGGTFPSRQSFVCGVAICCVGVNYFRPASNFFRVVWNFQ